MFEMVSLCRVKDVCKSFEIDILPECTIIFVGAMQMSPETCSCCYLPYFHYAAHDFFSLSHFLCYMSVNFSYFSKDLEVDGELTVINVSCTNNSSGKVESSHNFNVFRDFCCLAFLSLE